MLQHIPLRSAYLCQDCNSVGNCARQCPACASEVLLSLSAVLDREVTEVAVPQYSYASAMVA
jgi:ferredoxin